jgi:polyhydroxybutyrate depolymerase
VFFVGHSNGGFMSNRTACDVADRVAGIASLAGATWNDPAMCSPSRPVNVLLIHGDVDDTILYTGGSILGAMYPGARQTAAAWATENGCTGALGPGGPAIDLDTGLAGSETTVETTADCTAGGDVDLWTIVGGGHIPALQSTFAQHVWDWLAAHPR